ncbi:MAG TPA: hypothetical protein VFY49_00775 [Myxococcota bacterium]|nr:hypothetical protein [Myxococcota bacterium]
MQTSRSKKRARALSAALAGIVAGSTLAAGDARAAAMAQGDLAQIAAEDDGSNGCNGPNGCGGEERSDSGSGGE